MAAPSVKFLIPPGWDGVTASIDIGTGVESVAWITNASIDPDDRISGWPTKTTPQLSADQILIWVGAIASAADADVYANAALPLQLSQARFLTDAYENQPAPTISLFGPLRVVVQGTYLTLMTWLGSNAPQVAQIASAQAALTGLQVTAA